MKSFTFGLEKVLKLRQYYEDDAKIELGRATGALLELESGLAAVGRERARAQGSQFAPGNSANEIRQYMYYIQRLDNTAEKLIEEIAMAELKVEQAREAFLEASRERKVFDKLKEKRQKEYRKDVLIAETKILDDITSGVLARASVSA
jgi:flagellar FliJ protein